MGFYYPDWATNKMLRNIKDGQLERTPESLQINGIEMEFLNYAATELTYKEIAEKMICNPRTVESYRHALFAKLNLKTRVGLVIFAMKNSIIKA